MNEKNKGKIYRQFSGSVTSVAMNKTAVVLVNRTVKHKTYKKQYQVSRKYKVHDAKSECRVGDKVIFQECRPLSKDKRWTMVKKVN